MRYFETRFMEEAEKFIGGLDSKVVKKIIYNIDRAEQTNDPKLFKKLRNDIWELRIKFLGLQIRLLAFWDKSNGTETLVIATHGFIINPISKIFKLNVLAMKIYLWVWIGAYNGRIPLGC